MSESETGGTASIASAAAPSSGDREAVPIVATPLREVLTDYYQINDRDVESMMAIVSDTIEHDGCILYELLNDLLTGLGEFTMSGKIHGSAKWLDVFAHLAQRVMDEPTEFSKVNCPETVARLIGCRLGDDDARKKAENMLHEPVLRVTVEDADMEALVARDMKFKGVTDENKIARHRELLDNLKRAAGSDSDAESMSSYSSPPPPPPPMDTPAATIGTSLPESREDSERAEEETEVFASEPKAKEAVFASEPKAKEAVFASEPKAKEAATTSVRGRLEAALPAALPSFAAPAPAASRAMSVPARASASAASFPACPAWALILATSTRPGKRARVATVGSIQRRCATASPLLLRQPLRAHPRAHSVTQLRE
jgi:hypothetical protein